MFNFKFIKKTIFVLTLLLVTIFVNGCKGVESLELSESDITIAVGDEQKIEATVMPKDLDVKVVWSSSDNAIATVDQKGLIKGIGAGKATITVKADDVVKKVEVEVFIRKFNVIFNTNLGSNVPVSVVEQGNKVIKPIDPTKVGYTFKGWYDAPNLLNKFDFDTIINENTTIYAGWEQIVLTVSFESNGGSSVSSFDKVYGSKLLEAELPQAPTKEGHDFVGWFTDIDLLEAINFDNEITEDVTLYAKWEKKEYTVNFVTNGGSEVPSQVVKFQDKIVFENPTRPAYIFSGFYRDESLTTWFNPEIEVIFEDTTLYAKWDLGESIVSFETNGGSEIADISVTTLDKLSKPLDPTKTNFLFDGWYKDSNLTEVYDFDTQVEGDFVLYAKWKLDVAVGNKVEFVLNGGEFSLSSTDSFIKFGTQPLNTFSSIAYNSSPWNAELYATNAYIQKNVQSGSYWVKVGLKKNELGLFVVTGIVPSGNIDMASYDYFITAWPQAGDAFTFASSIQLGQIVTVTGFEIQSVSAGLIQGGTIKVYNADAAYEELNANLFSDGATLPTPYKAGSTFEGWYASEDFSGEKVTVASENVKLYAKWS